jgi:hypothetical protein
MWQYINLNPRKKSVGDCTIRAIGIATDRNWYDVYLDLCLFGMLMCDMPSSNAVTTAYLKKKGFRRHTVPEELSEDYSHVGTMLLTRTKGNNLGGYFYDINNPLPSTSEAYFCPVMYFKYGYYPKYIIIDLTSIN